MYRIQLLNFFLQKKYLSDPSLSSGCKVLLRVKKNSLNNEGLGYLRAAYRVPQSIRLSVRREEQRLLFCKKRFDEIFALLVYYFYVTKLMFFCASKRMHILQSEPLIIVKKTFCYYDKRMLKWKYIMDNFLLKGFELYKNEDIFSLGNLQIRSMIH